MAVAGAEDFYLETPTKCVLCVFFCFLRGGFMFVCFCSLFFVV